MIKREILIESVVAKKTEELKRLTDEELLQMVGEMFFCHECPLNNGLCDKYPQNTCTETIKAWFYEGVQIGDNN